MPTAQEWALECMPTFLVVYVMSSVAGCVEIKRSKLKSVCLCLGKVIHSMVAHLDAVTSLAIDPSGLYLLSGSEDFEMIAISIILIFIAV